MLPKSILQLLRSGRVADADFPAGALHGLAGADFRDFAQLLLAVNRYIAVGDHELGLAAAVRHAGEFQEVAQRDMFAAQFKFRRIHRAFIAGY